MLPIPGLLVGVCLGVYGAKKGFYTVTALFHFALPYCPSWLQNIPNLFSWSLVPRWLCDCPPLGQPTRLEGADLEALFSFLQLDKALAKSFLLDSRPSLRRRCWVYLMTTLLILSEPRGDLALTFIVRTWRWGCGSVGDSPTPKTVGHRGFTHSCWFMLNF